MTVDQCILGLCLYVCDLSQAGGTLARWQHRVSRSRVCWRMLSVCWAGARNTTPPLGASGSEEGLVTLRVSRQRPRLLTWTTRPAPPHFTPTCLAIPWMIPVLALLLICLSVWLSLLSWLLIGWRGGQSCCGGEQQYNAVPSSHISYHFIRVVELLWRTGPCASSTIASLLGWEPEGRLRAECILPDAAIQIQLSRLSNLYLKKLFWKCQSNPFICSSSLHYLCIIRPTTSSVPPL